MTSGLALAHDLIRRGDRGGAAEVCRGMLAGGGDQAGALHLLGILEHQAGRQEEAAAFFERALAFKPDEAPIWSDLGFVEALLGRAESALGRYDRALSLRPDLAEAHGRRGDLLSQLSRFDLALASYDRAVAINPRFAQALNNRGLVLMALGRRPEALDSYDRILAFQPDYAAGLCNRGRTLQELGRAAEALESYDRALAARPDYPEALNNRGALLHQLGRGDDALASLGRALALRPDDIDALNNRGNLLKDLNRPVDALADYDRAVSVDPLSPLTLTNRANLLMRIDRTAEALDCYDLALAFNPLFSEALAGRGLALWTLGRAEDALAVLDQALSVNPHQAKAHNIRGVVLVGLRRATEALASYDQALAADPDFADALGNKGLLLMELGRLEEAREAIERSIALSPASVRAYYDLTLCKRMQRDDPHVQAMLDLAARESELPVDDRIHLRFALSKAFSDIGDHERSFAHLSAGAVLKRGQTVYDEGAALAELANIGAGFGARRMGDDAGAGHRSDIPVFIVGMPRSGSTLVEQILASHPQVFAAGESGAFADALAELGGERQHAPDPAPRGSTSGWRQLAERYLHGVTQQAPDARRIVDKTLDNFRLIGAIHLALPNARIIHTQRDPIDTCLSCFTKLFGDDLAYTYDLGELGRYYRGYEALMAHWRSVLPQGVMLDAPYEDLTADLEGWSRRIVAHCGLAWDARCLDFHQTDRWVHTASAAQVRKPIYRDSVGRWRPYEAFLQPLFEALGPAR